MKLHPRLSRAAVELVTRFETFQPTARRTAAGGWTLGYGHTRSAREGAQVSRSDAEALLFYDLSEAAHGVEVALFAPVTQRQFEALTAFAFNIGADNFRRSTALARMNGGAELDAADEIERWRHAELGAGAQVVDALVRRRAAEKAHFLGLPEGCSKSPSALLRPLPMEAPHEVAPPPLIEPPAPSATLAAANTVQARLRELVPDPAPLAEPPLVEEPPLVTVDGVEALETRSASPEPHPVAEEVLPDPAPYSPPPPPILETVPPTLPANDVSSPPPLAPETSPASKAPAAPTQAEPAPATPSRKAVPVRGLYAGLTALGACLVMAAVVLILGGKPGFAQLGLGVVGALAMIPGVYGLIEPSRPDA